MTEKKVDHFTIFNSLFTKKRPTDEEISKFYVPFLANRQLMSDMNLVFIANNLNQMNLKPLAHYNILFSILPEMKNAPFLKFVKETKKDDEMVKKTASYYDVSYRIAEEFQIYVKTNKKLEEEIEYNWAEKHGELSNFLKNR